MELIDRLTNLTVAAANMANNAIESGKLSLKISGEESSIRSFTNDIGALMVDKLDGGLDFDDDEIKALYNAIVASRETIAGYEAEIEANRPVEVVNDPEPGADEEVCPKCGAPLAPDAVFCDQCGTKVEDEPAPAVCGECGTELKEDAKFCPKCGTPVPEKDS